jgi:hypothetical protein
VIKSGSGARISGAIAATSAALIAVFVLVGCGSVADNAGAAQHTKTALVGSSPSDGTSSPTPSSSAQPSSSAAAHNVAAGPGQCTASDLRVSVGQSNGTAGSFYYPLEFTNISKTTCTLYGYPGVSFVTKPGGALIGKPAVRNPTFAAKLVTLAAGTTAHAALRVVIAQNYPPSKCQLVTAHWLQVFPPGSYVALNVKFSAATCRGHIPGSILGIDVVQPGTSGP